MIKTTYQYYDLQAGEEEAPVFPTGLIKASTIHLKMQNIGVGDEDIWWLIAKLIQFRHLGNLIIDQGLERKEAERSVTLPLFFNMRSKTQRLKQRLFPEEVGDDDVIPKQFFGIRPIQRTRFCSSGWKELLVELFESLDLVGVQLLRILCL